MHKNNIMFVSIALDEHLKELSCVSFAIIYLRQLWNCFCGLASNISETHFQTHFKMHISS